MSVRLEMLQVARLAPKLLGDSAGLIKNFFLDRQTPAGGFQNRSGEPDLYYTVFGLEGALALQIEPNIDSATAFLRQFGSGGHLDFVHLCALSRCWAILDNLTGQLSSVDFGTRREIADNLERARTPDGGYHALPNAQSGTAYGCFLACCAYQDLGFPLPNPDGVARCLRSLETTDGAWSNERHMRSGSTNATAAAVTLLRHLRLPMKTESADWLLRQLHPQGGFVAAPGAPIPDLLSTATALHALAGMQRDIGNVRELTLDFIDSLWTNEGAFHGHWSDEFVDCEYTFYGLLALGHLAV